MQLKAQRLGIIVSELIFLFECLNLISWTFEKREKIIEKTGLRYTEAAELFTSTSVK